MFRSAFAKRMATKTAFVGAAWGCTLTLLTSSAQTAKPRSDAYSVIIDCTCEDAVGKAYSRALRDIVAKSPRYTEVEDTSKNRETYMRFSIVSIPSDGNESTANLSSAFSVVYAVGTTLVDQKVQACGKANANSCAQTIFDDFDGVFTELRKAISKDK